MNLFSTLKRSKGDPKVLEKGPSSLSSSDRLARNLGWFGVGLGVIQLFGATGSPVHSAWKVRRSWSDLTGFARSARA